MIDYMIPTWNSEDTLEITLKSIVKYGYPGQIIIVDRYSDDNTIGIAKKFNCKIVQSNAPLGASRKIGAQNALTDIVAFLDSDVELTEDWSKIIDCAVKKEFSDAGVISSYYKGCSLDNRSSPLKLNDGRNGAFGCCIISKDLILECDELDQYSSFEDGLFAQYIFKKYNLHWYILPYPVIHHEIERFSPVLKRRWQGAGLRKRDGFRMSYIRAIIGGAIFGIRHGENIQYVTNFILRCNFFWGYIFYKRFYELDRSLNKDDSVPNSVKSKTEESN